MRKLLLSILTATLAAASLSDAGFLWLKLTGTDGATHFLAVAGLVMTSDGQNLVCSSPT
ncbi:MAG: hypothetical protein NC336_09920 [Clostridium sp.]|nr:hypothetical protein [Clostridium sp.]